MTESRFDYVIVGAGTAGCTLASRLSEGGNASVLLLEAGGWDRDPQIRIPMAWGRLFTRRRHDWGFDSEPEPSLYGRQIECARGKVIGGSSSTNALAYVRGHRTDFDRWAEAGSEGWSYREVLPYFRRLERWEGGADAYRGGDGPVAVCTSRYPDRPLIDAWLEAGQQAGFGFNHDYNGADQEGFGLSQCTIASGRRCSAADAYLRPARRRRNLRVRSRSQALRVRIRAGRAAGVEYLDAGGRRFAAADREVIVCAGAIQSPQLLLLSGIGAADQLRRHGISVQAALPGVGENLQDHLTAGLDFLRRRPGPFSAIMRADRLARELASAYLFGRGLASWLPGGWVAFLRTHLAADVPDVQLIFRAAPMAAKPYIGRDPGFADDFGCRVALLRPHSRGRVTLASADPLAAPRIEQNFLSREPDLGVLRAGLRLVREIAARPALRPFVAREMLTAGEIGNDGKLDEFIRRTAATAHHPVGTCRMGGEGDADAVLDPALQVRGVAGLRVVDASVMPDLTGGNTNAPVFMIAERAADLIRGRVTCQTAQFIAKECG